jgi:hypothetical protein
MDDIYNEHEVYNPLHMKQMQIELEEIRIQTEFDDTFDYISMVYDKFCELLIADLGFCNTINFNTFYNFMTDDVINYKKKNFILGYARFLEENDDIIECTYNFLNSHKHDINVDDIAMLLYIIKYNQI